MTELFIPTQKNLRLKTYIYNQNQESDTAILICHGFSGSSSDAFYPQLCELLAQNFFVLRFDFRGQGLSDGNFYDSCLTFELEDLKNIVLYVKNHYAFKNVILLGHSFGAAVALLYAADHQTEISGLISVSGEGDLEKADEIEFSPQELQELMEHGETKIVNWSKNGEKDLIGLKHLADLQNYSTVQAVRKLRIPILFTHGDADDVIPVSRTQEMFQETQSPKAFEIFSGADHVYNVYTDHSLVPDLFRTITGWLQKMLH